MRYVQSRIGALAALSSVLPAVSSLVLTATPVAAQTAQQLPPIIIQGATLEARPAKSRAQARPAADASAATGDATAQPDGPAAATGTGSGETVDGVAAEKIASAVTVVTGAQLRAQQVRHAGDALRSLPGLHVNRSGSGAGKTQIRMRGAEGNHTLVLIDGIEANQANDGEFDFSDLSTEEIERIEVIRGPQSGLYGSKAIGGVVNVVTRSGRGPLTVTARAEGGTYRTRDLSARVSGGTDKVWISVGVHGRAQQDFNAAIAGNEEDPWRQGTLTLKGGAQIADGLVVDFNLRNSSKRLARDEDGGPDGTLFVATDANAISDVDVFLGGAKLTWDTFGGALTHQVRANRSTTRSADTSLIFGYSQNNSELVKYGYLATWRFDTPALLAARHTLSGLIEKENESFTPFSDQAPSAFTPDGTERERSRLATVAEYRGEFFDRLYLTASLRRDDNDVFRDFTTWRTGASLALREIGLRPHVSAGTGVALPGMFEQFGSVLNTFKGNPDLLPEESYGWDAGVEFSVLAGRATLDVTYFRMDLENEISGFGNTLKNLVGESRRSGWELSSRIQVTPSLTLGGAYTYLDATEPDGRVEVRRPRHTGRVDLAYGFDGGRGSINVAAAYNGGMKDNAFTAPFYFPEVRVSLDDYWLVSAAAAYKITEQVELFGRVENMLDQQYQEIYGYNSVGAAAFAGVRITLEDPSTKSWAKYR